MRFGVARLHHIAQRRALARAKQAARQVHPVVFGEQALGAGIQRHLNQSELVAPQVGQCPGAVRSGVDAQHPEAVEAAKGLQRAPRPAGLQQLEHAVRTVDFAQHAHAPGQLPLGVDLPGGDAAVASRHFSHAAGAGVGFKQIEGGAVALVAGKKETRRATGPHGDDKGAHTARRREDPGVQTALRAVLHIQAQVFVALLVLGVHKMAAVGQPVVVAATAPLVAHRVGRDRRAWAHRAHRQAGIQPHGL